MSARALPDRPARVLVMDLGGLGDNVHSLPALWLIRSHWPQAELHVMANAHVAALFELTPWVDRVWAYSKSTTRGVIGNWRRASELRRARFDVLIDLKATDRSSLFAWASRAPIRLGRRPADGGPLGWRHLFTGVMEHPYYAEPMYWQKWRCVHAAGFGAQGAHPEFHFVIDPAWRRRQGIASGDEGRYVHVSPCTTAVARELASEQLAALLDRMHAAFPNLPVVLSCADNARERDKLANVLQRVASPPWKVFAGSLDIPALAAVIQGAALNLSGDTGSLHLAMMTGTPAVAWFRAHKGQLEWIPHGARYRVLVAPGGALDALHGIETDALLETIAQVLDTSTRPAAPQEAR